MCWIIYPTVPALQAGHTHWGVLILMVWLSEQRGRDPAFHSMNVAPNPAWAAVSVVGRFTLPHLPLPCNPLNPLTTGLDFCQLCRASVANGQAASSCLATTKAPARSGLLVPPAMILQSRTNTAQFTGHAGLLSALPLQKQNLLCIHGFNKYG